MDAVKFIEERNRMCNSFSPDCEGCLVDEEKPVMDECCRWMLENPDRAVKIVEKWSAAHPRKTRSDEFLKHYPNAAVSYRNIIDICPQAVDKDYTPVNGCCDTSCDECSYKYWMQEVE